MENKVTLYIATHNVTGKKYFGKTEKWFTKEDLQKNYHGSGKYWSKHKKKHGNDITMEIYKICSLNESDVDYVKPIALKFSEENDIVKSKEWANEKFENGLDGNPAGKTHPMYGKKHTQESKDKISKSATGKTPSIETRKLISIKVKQYIIKKGGNHGKNNPMYGKNHSTITIQKLKNRIITQETKDKISKSNKGKIPYNKGKKGLYKHTEEAKQKIAECRKGKKTKEETKQKISKINKGKKRTEECRKKMGELQKNKPRVICPHCEKMGSQNNMTRWHFDNCKKK